MNLSINPLYWSIWAPYVIYLIECYELPLKQQVYNSTALSCGFGSRKLTDEEGWKKYELLARNNQFR